MKHLFVLLSGLAVIVSSTPDGQFNCTSGESLPAGLVCDFKKDCKDGSDEMFCGTYMVIKAQDKLNISSAARLVSFPRPAYQVICVSFWYHIFGNSIEAVVGGDQGSIAIDDIVVSSSADGSCPAERECTFQGSLCGLLPQQSANFSWSRVTGSSQPTNSSGPATDHTLGTEQGYYLSAQLWSHPAGSRGAMMTAVMEPTPPDGECLMFWYYMEGSDVGELCLYLQTHDSGKNPIQLWTRRGDQGKHWRHGRATLLSPDAPYQVIFEAAVGDGPRRDIAIDDLIVLNGVCPPTGFCDFEMDFCGWVNNPPPGSGVDWDWFSGDSEDYIGPSVDHSTESSLGHFALFTNYKSNNETIAQLESESMEAVDRACLEIWLHASAWSGIMSGITLTVFINETAELRPVWNASEFKVNKWIESRVDYSASGPHQIILQARSLASKEGSLALDDIHIIRDKTCNDIIQTTTPNPITTTTTTPVSDMDCTFEEGLCDWVQEVSDDLNWTLSSGLQVDQQWDGPRYDHTLGNNQGVFLLLNGSGSKDGERAVVSVPVISPASQICVGFWYYMLGSSVSALDLLVQTIKFSGNRDTSSQGFIAVDDVAVREGICSDEYACGFDSSWCGFENDVSYKGRWGRRQGTKHHVDHTYGTENGFYMTLMTNSTKPEIAQLFTPELHSATEMCVRFWYWLPANSSNLLAIHVRRSEELGTALWEQHEAASTGWEVAEVTVSSPAKFQVVFKAQHVPGMSSTVKIDDFSMKDGACSPPGSCDFESGQCTWVNIPREGGHDWVLASGGSLGPPTDHTTQTPDGWFLLSSSRQNPSSVAQVVSEWIQLKDTTSCFSFWYYMDNSDSGTVRVFNRSALSEQDLMFHSNSSGSGWSKVSQSVETSKPFQLLIQAEASNRGFIAIDDISLTPGLCQGWYMAVEPHRGYQMSPAALQSPTMKQASTTCMLHFYYNMYGEVVEELNVLLKVGSRTTPLSRLPGNHGDSWHHGEVTVGRIPHDFTILFEASRTFNKPGHIAIDDVDFTNCTLPEPQPGCPDSMFMCNNKVCVDPKHLCDFSDDCGDGSDENNCGVGERCSFEQGLCSWAGIDVDTHGAEWTRHTGQEAWPDNGPPRDHTKNSAAGHYVIPGAHLTVKGETSEILSKTLLPSSNCTVRFFYFSLNDAAARVTARSRTLRSGSDDRVLWLRETSQGYSWQRAEVTFSSAANTKIVFRYELGERPRGLVALDDISFSMECVFDPDNSKLPGTSPTSSPPTPSTAPTNPCQENEFFCWRSAGKKCIVATLRCDYHPDCPQGEDEAGCGPCTFESDECQWNNTGDGQSMWQRQKASNITQPSTDHTAGTGYYIRVNFIQPSTQTEAQLQSPSLPPSSPYCQLLFHFHISAQSAGSLRVLMQQAEGSEAILWSRSHNTVSPWTPEHLPLGLHQRPYKVWFSSINKATQGAVVAVDDISFLNCEKSYKPPALSSLGCSFEDGLCSWVQGAKDELDWLNRSGPTETPNTGPAGDHTTSKGKYLYIKSSLPSVKQNMAQLKSLLLPPAGERGYCFTVWYHMFGATVGSLKLLLQTADPLKKTLMWQKSGNQGDEWLPVHSHVTVQEVHQVILEATVGGEAGDIAIDDISLTPGPCPLSDLCDFEEGSCEWQQQTTDDFDWVRQWGDTPNPNTGPDSDHTTNTPVGHYYCLPSSAADQAGQTAAMSSPLYPAGKGSCVQLWYHMYGEGMGTLNVYQQSEEGKEALIFSQTGDQGRLWRFAQASLLPRVQPYRIVVEGVKAGPTQEGDMAFDDVQLTDAQCSPHGYCDFEGNMCSWSNLGGEVRQGDWLRGQGASPNPNTGPSVDHTTNSTHGHYVYVDSSVGEWGDMSFLVSDVYHPSTRGHCLTFWYHMYGNHVGTLKVYINDRKMHAGDYEEGLLKWIETGDKGDTWQEARFPVKHKEAFWFVFVYQRGKNTGGDVALDDITILPRDCYPDPPVDPSDNNKALSIGLAVGLTLLAGVILSIFLFMMNWKWRTMNQAIIVGNDMTNQSSVSNLTTDGAQNGAELDFSFSNNLYDASAHGRDSNMASSI
ncbi:apical endosomal glycoprotein [Embiotoca jacksoni]|uniref:apical endosomal glycoprotein n=1 Tax=Embiotoca jacksoni TaxID=100190 RepID=UPI0037049D93